MRHLQEVNMSYFQHMRRALGFSLYCVLWAGEAILHALVPDLCTNTAEKMKTKIKELEEE